MKERDGKAEMDIPSVLNRHFPDLGALLVRLFANVPGNLLWPGPALTERAYSYSYQTGRRTPINREITLVAFVQLSCLRGPFLSCKEALLAFHGLREQHARRGDAVIEPAGVRLPQEGYLFKCYI